MSKIYTLNNYIEVEYQGEGPWRSYHVESEGDNLEELLDNAIVYEIDQEGDVITEYKAKGSDIEEEAEDALTEEFMTTTQIMLTTQAFEKDLVTNKDINTLRNNVLGEIAETKKEEKAKKIMSTVLEDED